MVEVPNPLPPTLILFLCSNSAEFLFYFTFIYCSCLCMMCVCALHMHYTVIVQKLEELSLLPLFHLFQG